MLINWTLSLSLSLSLSLTKHQIITNYDDSKQQESNPQMGIPNWHKEKIKLFREGDTTFSPLGFFWTMIINEDNGKILDFFCFKWLYSLWWSMTVLLNYDCRWQKWKQMYHFISRWRCDFSLSFGLEALCPLFLLWPHTAQ